MLRLGIAIGGARLICLARRGFLGGQPFEVVPPAIILASMLLAEVPAVLAIGRFGRRAVSGLVAAIAIAHAHLRRLARRAIATPTRKTPGCGSCRARHRRPCSQAMAGVPSHFAAKIPVGL